MIKTLKKLIKKISFKSKEQGNQLSSKKETLVKEYANIPTYLGVPASVVAPYDPWFGDAPKTEKVMKYVQKKNEELYAKLAEEPQPKEPENIHEVIYKIATQSQGSWQENIGGSENFHEGTNGWNSGTGMAQFN